MRQKDYSHQGIDEPAGYIPFETNRSSLQDASTIAAERSLRLLKPESGSKTLEIDWPIRTSTKSDIIAVSKVYKGTLKSNTSPGTKINIRSSPNGDLKTERPAGTEVLIIEESAPDQKGYTWYKISYGNTANDVGWVRNDVITLSSLVPPSTPSPAPSPTPSPVPSPTPSEDNTLLYFETTDQLAIRVFEPGGLLIMNIYNKASNQTQRLNAVYLPPVVSAPKGAEVAWQCYVARQDNRLFVARFVPFQQVELIVSRTTNGAIEETKPGFNARGTAFTVRA